MKWIKDLKLAIINKDISTIEKLINSVPEIKDINIGKEALALITQAIEIVELEKKRTLEAMLRIKKIKNFI